ncbi:carboxylating nicotinate-nucleotide diphosphorylase [Methylophaga sp. OBS3]|uniref:carboxylating nicotinate-nucleotide diphosphorylase n=1 Tax=Methylophaga sp. OBS3 TaxID=2991934 RepID=UPI00224CDF3D|nr:carboxylating nicotinate-nucleotide diphosphorylase [Methylophaga sp. OBS3]MCX4189148.1 carboxylating nicotinate-nucleotide diphosphorylase [Methylophaga sp. OBS3]
MPMINPIPAEFIQSQVRLALLEDVGQQDLTADLIPLDSVAHAKLISREAGVLCGSDWLTTVFKSLDQSIEITWFKQDGDVLAANDTICEIKGSARHILTGERTALNFLQTLSATASITRQYADALSDLPVALLDTRKTLPGYRMAQKYAVRCGGGVNHRFGLFDAILIKENHIQAAGNIGAAVLMARNLHPGISIEVEVESLDELAQALAAQADIILLDNFSIEMLRQAVSTNQSQALLEASGGISLDNIRTIAETGVDRISVGALTKDIRALDLSLRFI